MQPLPTELGDVLAMTEEQLAGLDADSYAQVAEMLEAAKEAARKAEEERQKRLEALGQRIVGVYNLRKGQRQELEQRWLADIRRYNGQYDPEILKALQNRKYGSKAYVPLVRRIVNIVEARLVDLLFPNEERNWAIDPTPVPMLVQAETLGSQLPPDAMIPAGPDGQPMPVSAVVAGIRELREEARSKADGMTREVDDQLRQANYGACARRVIHEGMVIGTGVLKGPTVLNRTKKVWSMKDGAAAFERVEDLSPTVVDVSAWDYFPDMSARTPAESESDIQRHYLTKAQLAALAKQPGFDADAIREALRVEPSHTRDSNRDELREAAGTQGVVDARYVMLEYHGPIESQELQDLGLVTGDDPLQCYECVLWVLEDGRVLKAVINPMDTAERPFSVWCWEKDPASIFGFGLSYELADLSEAANSSFRAALDNLGLAVGPQIVVNSKVMRPQNGEWVIEPNKIWEIIKSDADARQAFAFFQVDSRIAELMGVFDRSKALMDDIGGPVMAMQGQEAPSYLDTARGVGIAWNASNIWMRRAVRNWDDDVTSILIGRFVDWNMQYSAKTEIKGDLLATARGTSALLEAESMMNKVGMFQQAAKDIPMPYAKRVAQLRSLARSLRLDPADLLPDDAEVKKIGEQVDNQPPPTDPAVERLKLQQMLLADKQAQRQHDAAALMSKLQVQMAEIASREGLTREQAEAKYGIEMQRLQAQLADADAQRAHEAQMLNAELVTKAQMGSGV